MELVVPENRFLSAPSSPRRLLGFSGAGPANQHAGAGDEDVSLLSPSNRRLRHFSFDNYYTSAPVSPARSSAALAAIAGVQDEDYEYQPRALYSSYQSAVPFQWEEKPGTPKPCFVPAAASADGDGDGSDDDGFEFAKGGAAVPPEPTATAEQLFDDGVIRPLKLPPRLQAAAGEERSSTSSSPRSPSPAAAIFSPRRRSRTADTFDPFLAAMVATSKEIREPGSPSKALSPLSPLRNESTAGGTITTVKSILGKPPVSNGSGKKRWSLINFLFFRKETVLKRRLPLPAPPTASTKKMESSATVEPEPAEAPPPRVLLTTIDKTPAPQRIPLPLPPARQSMALSVNKNTRLGRRGFGKFSSFSGAVVAAPAATNGGA